MFFLQKKLQMLGFSWNIAWIYLTPSIWNALRIGFRNEQGKYFNQGVRFDIHNWLTLFTISCRPFIFCKPMKMLRKAQLSPTIIEMYSTVNTSKNGGHNLLLVSKLFQFLGYLEIMLPIDFHMGWVIVIHTHIYMYHVRLPGWLEWMNPWEKIRRSCCPKVVGWSLCALSKLLHFKPAPNSDQAWYC